MCDIIFNEVDKLRNEMIDLSKKIHSNPELAFEEYKSAGFIKEMLKNHGFDIEENSGGLKTAFKARFKGKGKGPKVAFLAEYDALPEIGHACGHNLIAATSTGAAIALSKIMENICGEVLLMGTPGEEGLGGKIILLDKGEFDDVDYALMTHPSTVNLIARGGLATTEVVITYHGVSAHSASPESGVNALQAVIQTFNLIDSIRTCMPNKTNINGIITAGGTASNVIPDFAECKFCVRAFTFKDLKTVVGMIKDTIKSVEIFTGAKAEVKIGPAYTERYSNLEMDETFKKYMELQGETVSYPDPDAKVGSSDIGNVTLKIPAIHAYVKITDKSVSSHHRDFAEEAVKEQAHEAMVKGAKALAAAAYDIFTDEGLRSAIKREFDEKVPYYDNFEL